MKRCVQCGGTDLKVARVRRTVTVGARTLARMIRAKRCAACREVYFADRDLEAFELAIAAGLATKGPVDGEAFRFMRKAISLPAMELAGLLGVTPETVSRWEHGKLPVSRASFALLGAMVLERVHGSEATLERLRALPGAA
jgi:DNA-binding transcriptional regulator YiaG